MNRSGYVLYIVLSIVGTAMIVIYFLAGLNLQRNVMNRNFLLNRQAYYLLRSAARIAFSDFEKRANTAGDPLYSLMRSNGNSMEPLLLSRDAMSSLMAIATHQGFRLPEISLYLHWEEKEPPGGGFWDPFEKKGTVRFLLSSGKQDKNWSMTVERELRIANSLPPVVSFFTLYAARGIDGDINSSRDYRDAVSLYNGSGMVYVGKEQLLLNLTAGAEEFLLPERTMQRYEDKVAVRLNFCHSPAYAKYFESLGASMYSSFLNIFGDNRIPSPSFVLGDVNMSYLSLSALYSLSEMDQLDEFEIQDHGRFQPERMIKPFSTGDVVHPNVVYMPERDVLQVVTPEKYVSWRGEAASFDLKKVLLSRITDKPDSDKDKKEYLSRFLKGSTLDLRGHTLFWPGCFELEEAQVLSPGIVIAEKGAVLSDVSGSSCLTVAVLSGDVRISGDVSAYLCLLSPGSRLLNTGMSLTGGLYMSRLTRENFRYGGFITYNNSFSSYYDKSKYWVLLDARDRRVDFEAE